MRTEVYTIVQVALSLCTIQLYRVVRSSDHGDLSRKNPFDHASLSDEETRDVKKKLDEIDKKFDAASFLSYEPFEEYVKQVEVKQLKLTKR